MASEGFSSLRPDSSCKRFRGYHLADPGPLRSQRIEETYEPKRRCAKVASIRAL